VNKLTPVAGVNTSSYAYNWHNLTVKGGGHRLNPEQFILAKPLHDHDVVVVGQFWRFERCFGYR